MDPFSQPFTLLFPDGSPFNVTMDQMTWFHFYGVRLGINIGSAIGATAMMLVALILLTKREKRSSPIFILNALALTINLSRCVVFAAYLSGPFQNPYAVLTDDWAHISALDKSNSIADPVLTVLLLVVIEASLLLQVKVILGIVNRTKRFWILAACGSVGLVAVGFRFAFMVVNIQYIMALQPGSSQAFQDLAQRANITIMVSLCFFTAVFVGKLGLAIFKRRQLGLKRFGPMQIVFIMGLQTLFVPSKSFPWSSPHHHHSRLTCVL
jgi:pheromone alpha factor receptor